MKMKKLLILAVVLSALLSIWLVNPAGATWPPLGEPGSIKVYKFNDINGNGVQDGFEGGISGWLIRIYRYDPTGLYMVAEGHTGSDGTVTFADLPAPTQYKVWEEKRDCWEPTTPSGMNYWSHDGTPGYYTLVWTASSETKEVEFGNVDTCTPPPPPPGTGTGTPGYWKNHPDAWPVEGITIGGVTYDKDTVIAYMSTPEKGDKTYTMFRALVAAELNVLIGNDASCIQATIDAADAWMMAYGPVDDDVKVKAKSDAWKEGEPLYEMLDDYNNGLLCAPSRG